MFFRSYIFWILKKHQCTTSLRLDLKKLNNKWQNILTINNRKPSKVITFIVSKVILVKTFYLYTIECPSSCGKSSAHDVHIINLSLQHEIKILADKKETVSPPSSLNITRVSNLYKLIRHLQGVA